MGPGRVGVERLAVELPPRRDQLGADPLVGQALGVALGQRLDRVAARPRRPDRDPAHRLHPAGDDDVVGAGDHALGREVGRLLAGPALPVDGRPGHALREAGREQRGARDVQRLVADLPDAAAR